MTASPSASGQHLIADIAAKRGLDDVAWIEATLREAAKAARVTVLDVRLHHFGGHNGVTGVALLAESHISIHTWPEHGLAAIDVFVCGATADARAALAVIEARLEGRATFVSLIPRLDARDTVTPSS
ncbi:adenosylmethionine decarboxylase [Novosphingobium sp.]|uniref:adenosylmethionine decarboxylase n=1 Tax=Novosphingobium sp. TaxID=1874826 RepID=UPI0025D3CA17|nr:adenosylmethionine decarboxylase [Novosphingobium sp.]